MLLVTYLSSNTDLINMLCTWYRITVDQVVTPNPAKVGTVIISPASFTKKTHVSLYDGESTSDPPIMTIRTFTGETKTVNFQPCLQTQRGLYADCGGDMGEVLIQLTIDPE